MIISQKPECRHECRYEAEDAINNSIRERKNSTETATMGDGEEGDESKARVNRFKQVNRIVTAKRFTERMRLGHKKMKEADFDDELIPEVRRRFQFNIQALQTGKSMNDLFENELPPEEDFNDIVDWDDERMQHYVSTTLVGKMLEHVIFRATIISLIIINAFLIAMATDEGLSEKYATVFSISEQFVTMIFVCEVLLKWYFDFWLFWKTGWNVFDFVILVTLLLGPSMTFLGTGRILRILRIVRAFRSLKSVSALTGLTIVVQTIAQSIPDMANIFFLLVIIMMVLAVAGVTLFGKEVPRHFGDIFTAMFSLFVCVTQDGWVDIMIEFKARNNAMIYYGGMAYFLVAILIGAFIFANLIVAVVVTNLEFAMKEMKAERRAQEDLLESATDDAHHDVEHDYVPIVTAFRANYNADVAHQHPLELADFSHLTVEKLEHYFLILTAIEENLAEYNGIREDLDQVIDVIKAFNLMDGSAGSFSSVTSQMMAKDVMNEFSKIDLKKGDILSNLIKLEGRNLLNSTGAGSIGDLRKTGKLGVAKGGVPKIRRSTLDRLMNESDDN